MSNIEALKKLAKKICSTATDAELNKITTIDAAICFIADKFDGKPVPTAQPAQGANAAAQPTTSANAFANV